MNEDNVPAGYTPTYGDAVTNSGTLSITNTYSVSPVTVYGKESLSGRKTLTGRDLKADEFSFQLKDASGKLVQTVTNDESGNFHFDDLTFDEPGTYTYTVSEDTSSLPAGVSAVTAGPKSVTIVVTDNGDGTYTIAGRYVTGDDIAITISKISPLDKFDFSVYEYVKVDGGKSVFLILANVKSGETLGEGKVPAYDGSNMYTDMSGRYDHAYSWLVFSESDAATLLADVKNHITLVTGEAKSYKSNNDVNYTGTADINDAQLVYNIYNAKYDSFDVVEMKMFLSADINGDKQVNSLDASAIARGTVLF